jgi:hypothetical protein
MQGNLYLVNENLNERMPILKTIKLNQNQIIIYIKLVLEPIKIKITMD